MRKISQEAAIAFMNCQSFKKSNTEVTTESYNNMTDGLINVTRLFLYGNFIADRKQYEDGTVITMISSAGWRTHTTKERLNALPRVNIHQRKGVWYLNGQEWDGKFVRV